MTKLVAVPQKLCCGARDAVGSCVSVHGVCMVCAWYVCVCVARVVCSAQNRATQAANNKSRNKVEGGGEEKEGKRKMLSLSLSEEDAAGGAHTFCLKERGSIKES